MSKLLFIFALTTVVITDISTSKDLLDDIASELSEDFSYHDLDNLAYDYYGDPRLLDETNEDYSIIENNLGRHGISSHHHDVVVSGMSRYFKVDPPTPMRPKYTAKILAHLCEVIRCRYIRSTEYETWVSDDILRAMNTKNYQLRYYTDKLLGPMTIEKDHLIKRKNDNKMKT